MTGTDRNRPPGAVRGWDAIRAAAETRAGATSGRRSRELDLRVVRASGARGADPRFQLVGARRSLGARLLRGAGPGRGSRDTPIPPPGGDRPEPVRGLCLPGRLAWLKQRPKLICRVARRLADGEPPLRLRWRRRLPIRDRAALHAIRRADATRALSAVHRAACRGGHRGEAGSEFHRLLRSRELHRRRAAAASGEPGVAWIGVLERYKDPAMLAEAWRVVAPRGTRGEPDGSRPGPPGG